VTQSEAPRAADGQGGELCLASAPATTRLRRAAIALAGFGVLLLGVALLVVPIPGTTVVVIPLGLTILAKEFAWARRLRDWSTDGLRRTWATLRHLFGARPLAPVTAHRL